MFLLSSRSLTIVAALMSCQSLQAQENASVRVRAEIISFQDGELSVRTREGRQEKLILKEPVVSVSIASSLDAIKPDDFVGTAALQQPDGSWRALEVRVFPTGSRSNEGVSQWDLAPGSSMTNAVVSGIEAKVGSVQGRELVLAYNGAQRRVLVEPLTPVVTTRPGNLNDLQPGERIFVLAAQRLQDGTLQASRITVGAKGVNPPQ